MRSPPHKHENTMNTNNTIVYNGKTFRADTQQGKTLAYLLKYGSITAREAFIRLDINSPRKILSNLREQGLIREEDVKVLQDKGNGRQVQRTHYHRYYLTKMES